MGMTTRAANEEATTEGLLLIREASNLPQTTTTTFFNVVGMVEITELIFVVDTTAIQNQADNVNWTFTPTGGSVGDISGTVNVANAAIGAYGVCQGPTDAGALSQAITLVNLTGATGNTLRPGRGIICKNGALGFKTSASNTGKVKVYLRYRPLDGAGYVTVA